MADDDALNKVDVVIIGGGLAGLSAALKLKDENDLRQLRQKPPISYVVLEADDRLGGRTWSKEPDKDYGGGYVGATQNYIQNLIRRYGIPIIEEYLPQDGRWLFEDSQGNLSCYAGNNPYDLPGGANAVQCLGLLDAMTLEMRAHLDDPSKSRLKTEDERTVQAWIEEQQALFAATQGAAGMSPLTTEAFTASVRSAFSLEPRELSPFFLLYYAATAGGYSALVDVAGGDGAAEATRFANGTKDLVDAIAADVGADNIQLEVQVKSVASNADGALVSTDSGQWQAKNVIVAMAPPASARIEFSRSPKHDAQWKMRDALSSAMDKALGRTIKGFVRFKRPFWRLQDPILMGYVLSMAADYKQFPLDWTLDNVWDAPAPPSGSPPPTGPRQIVSLMTFIVGDAAAYWSGRDPTERATAVIAHLKKIYKFDDSELFNPDELASNYAEEDWPLQRSRGVGAPDAMMPPGALSQFGAALRASIGPIHWAGAETASEWCGYMNGAIESGIRAASEVI
ncbi:MAG TPA: FAD-dependent oxidoreductase [Polyangiaceae bacterium]|jgi:monoamine oxidase